jgi:hypothetical protein
MNIPLWVLNYDPHTKTDPKLLRILAELGNSQNKLPHLRRKMILAK